jgi:hypothetical protein
MTEDEILSRQSYAEESAPPETVEARANDLVNQIMHQLRGEYDLTRPIDGLSDQQKMRIHAGLCAIVAASMRGKPLVELPAQPVAAVTVGQPLEPETEGAVFTVQVGGLLLSEQTKP